MAQRDQESKAIGIIGGSGLYQMEGLVDLTEHHVDTPFGPPSDNYISGRLADSDLRLIFLPRHGRGHRYLPSEINYPANIHGFKQLGVEHLVSVSAVGSLREEIHPGDIVLADQFIDRTRGRRSTFFGDGAAAHVQFGDPVCAVVHEALCGAADAVLATPPHSGSVHKKGTYVVMEGPAFSTRAESHLYRSWGASVIGMTNLPEAKLAREAELCYATVALSTDYDCWHTEEVSVEAVIAVVQSNVKKAQAIVKQAAQQLAARGPRTCRCASATRGALMTSPAVVPVATRQRLSLILKDLG